MSRSVDEDFTINLFDVVFFFWAKKKVIFFTGFCGAIIGGLYGIFATPEYVSKAVIFPNAQRSSLSDFMEVLPSSGAGVALLEARLVSRSISERVAEIESGVAKVLFRDDWDDEAKQWRGGKAPSSISVGGILRREHLEVSANSRKGIVELIVRLPDSAYSKLVADAYLRALKESIRENIGRDLEENRRFLETQEALAEDPQMRARIQMMLARTVELSLVNNPKDFQILEYPSYPIAKSGPKLRRSIVIGTLVAAAGSVMVLFGLVVLMSVGKEWKTRNRQVSR